MPANPLDMNKKRSDRQPKRDAKGPKSGGYQGKKEFQRKPSKPKAAHPGRRYDENAPVRLNKFIANSGICSRREADVLIKTGVVSINGEIVTELGTKVKPGDVVKYDGHTIAQEKKRYVLLNKPKNFITAVNDPLKRKTVMSLIKGATKEPIFPVDKMDRQTTGLLLFTNDQELARRMSRNENKLRMIYQISLKEKVKPLHIEQMKKGVEIEGLMVQPDDIQFVGDGSDPHEVGVTVTSLKAAKIIALFEHYGYHVTRMDRVTLGSLTKKDLPRGQYRALTKEEVGFLYMNS